MSDTQPTARITGKARSGCCHRCGGIVNVLYRRDQTLLGMVVHRTLADCLRHTVEGTPASYDVRQDSAGEVQGLQWHPPRRKKGGGE